MAATTLQELYVEEMRDLISGNDQMQAIMTAMAERASNEKLKSLFQKSIPGIGQHTQALINMIGGDNRNISCRAMEGLVEECKRHALESDLPSELRDIALIAQYQRMSHYGIAGFGTVAAYAQALGRTDDVAQLKQIVSDIYRADEYSTQLAEGTERAVAMKP